MNAISEYITNAIYTIKMGLTAIEPSPTIVMTGVSQILSVILVPLIVVTAIAVTALVFSVRSYRTNKKILKKLEKN